MSLRFGPGLPTRAADWRLIGRTVRLVLSVPSYAMLSVSYAVFGLSLFVVSRNVAVLWQVVVLGEVPLPARLRVLVGLYPGFGSAYTAVQSVALVSTAVLVGINLAVATYHFREHRVSLAQGSGSLGGVVLGTLGAGCVACGTAVLGGVLSVFGASGLLLALPFDGLEFTGIAMAILLLSLYWLADGMRGGKIAGCPVDSGSVVIE